MARIEENFVWYKAPGYRVESDPDAAAPKHWSPPPADHPGLKYKGVKRLVPVGGASIQIQPLESGEILARVLLNRFLAAYKANPKNALEETAIRFATKYGMLRSYHQDYKEDLSYWVDTMQSLAMQIEMADFFATDSDPFGKVGRWSHDFAEMKVGIGPSKDDGLPSLIFEPKDLAEAMLFQVAKHVVSGGKITSCKKCGTLMEGGTGTGKHADRLYCSTKCKDDAKNEKKRRERLEAAHQSPRQPNAKNRQQKKTKPRAMARLGGNVRKRGGYTHR